MPPAVPDMSGTVLITGGGQRIGFFTALGLQAMGYQVVVSYRTPRPELDVLQEAGVGLIPADFSSLSGIEDFVLRLTAEVTVLRAVIHNASLWYPDHQVDELAAEHFQQMFNLHMLAPYLINRACQPLLMSHDGARDIIHMTDWVVSRGSDKHAAYAATKAGLENQTLSFARLFAPAIKVNAIAPALICFNENDDEAYRLQAVKKSLLEIVPGEQVVLDTILYLFNSPYVTGACLPLHGGRHLK